MRATRRNMDACLGLGVQLENDTYGEDGDWDHFSATSNDYWTAGLDDDLGGRLVAHRSVYLEVEDLDLWTQFLKDLAARAEQREMVDSR